MQMRYKCRNKSTKHQTFKDGHSFIFLTSHSVCSEGCLPLQVLFLVYINVQMYWLPHVAVEILDSKGTGLNAAVFSDPCSGW